MMAIEVGWEDTERTILHYVFTGRWTWREAYTTFALGNQLMSTVKHPVSLLFDLIASENIPHDVLIHAFRITSEIPRNWELAIVVGTDTLLWSIVSSFSRLHRDLGAHFRTTGTLDEAHSLITQYRAEPRTDG